MSGAEQTFITPSGAFARLLRARQQMAQGVRRLEVALRAGLSRAPAPASVDVKPFLLDLLERLDPETPAARVITSIGGRPRAFVDPHHLERILTELVRGAAAGSPPGAHVAVTCSAGAVRLRITVRSSGPDVPREDAGRLFEREGRLHAVRALAEANGGHTSAETADGFGLAVHVFLPLRPA